MRKTYLFIISSLVFFSAVNGQTADSHCGTPVPCHAWEESFQQLIRDFKIQNIHQKTATASFTIPVIFHLVHSGQAIGTYPNLLKAQIESQMLILNQDFNANAYNKNNYPPNAFADWALNQSLPAEHLDSSGRIKMADFRITFCLASQDVAGNQLSEPGINRINFSSMGLQNPATFSTQTSFKTFLDNSLKPASIWDPKNYLNVWITDKHPGLTSGGVSSVPPFSGLTGIPNTATDSTDGIWCYAKALGAAHVFPGGFYASNQVDGRTLTHETGHYLGLRHIWGDAICATDYCDDTPPAQTENNGSPVYPHKVGTCLSSNINPNGEMFMNFMDYTLGPSKYMFTTDQQIRAHVALLNSPLRSKLGTRELCAGLQTHLTETDSQKGIPFFPNPSKEKVFLEIVSKQAVHAIVSDLYGHKILETDDTSFSVETFAQGVYILQLMTVDSSAIYKLFKE